MLIFAVLVAFFCFYRGKIGSVLSPFFISIPLAYIVKPPADKLTARKIPAGLSILIVYLVFFLLLAAACIFLIPEAAANIRELMNTLPDFVASYEKLFNGMLSAVMTSKWSDDIKLIIFRQIENGTAAIQKYLLRILDNSLKLVVDTVKIVFDLTVAMVITYYVLKDSEKFKDYALSPLPPKWRNSVAGAGREISRILANFIQGQLLTALIVGILETIGLMLVGMKYPIVLGMAGGLANIIPYFGPYIGAVPALAVALTISPAKVLWSIAVFVVVQQIDNSFISPKIIEGKLGLHPVATIFAVLAGGEFFGVPGMLLSVPAVAILRVIANHAVEAIARR